jgi:hypothetical protein
MTTKVRLLKDYPMGNAKAGDIVDGEYEPWNPTEDHSTTKRRAIRRGIWHVRWTERFSTSFVDGLDAVAAERRTAA